MNDMTCRITICLMIATLLTGGCASMRVIETRDEEIRLSSQGRLYVGDTLVALNTLGGELRKRGYSADQQITIEIPHNTSPNAITAIGRELAAHGYRRVIFSKPRQTIVEKGDDPFR